MSGNKIENMLSQFRIRPSKRFGQHFLIDEDIRDAIILELEDKKDFYLEIGPGPGILTEKVLEKGLSPFTVCEIERNMIEILEKRFGDSVSVIKKDGARLNISEKFSGKSGVVFGNLPYNSGTAILRNVIRHSTKISTAIFMLQKEVAHKIIANPEERLFSPMAGLIHFTGKAQSLFDVPPSSFRPPPEVQSSVIRADFSEHSYSPAEIEKIFKILWKLFSHRRKTMNNIFKMHGFDKILFEKYNIQPSSRIEKLSFDKIRKLVSSIMECQ
ncbi:MAG: 16S rRNA (adenine(1518)-N(6)/adenine(1519)-N(6))-dimethyltransferase RsmA [bacterium]